MPPANMITPPMAPRPGAANGVVWKYAVGIAFWMAGVPGRAVIVKVNEPSAIAPGIRRFGMACSRNKDLAIGYTANATTNSDTPP